MSQDSNEPQHTPPGGAQRLSIEQLRQWESLGYGMFIHFGMSTYDGNELSWGDRPSTDYAPDKLDVDQWVSVARDAGMAYAVLTTKHVSGHCLWPSQLTNYHVGTSSNKTDVVEAFVTACQRREVRPGFYYCSWDNHHLFGSQTPTMTEWDRAFTTQAYREFQLGQIEELLTRYGPIDEMWIDIPNILSHEGRRNQYEQITRLQPDAVVMMNHGFGDGSRLNYNKVWPTDLMAIERWLPSSNRGYKPWHRISHGMRLIDDGTAVQTRREPEPPQDYYIPAEVCDPIGYDWFFHPRDSLRSDLELLGMRLVCRERRANLLLDVPPDKSGRIPQATVDALMRLRQNYERVVGNAAAR
jgi:alpha-L-fucosidase